MAAARSAYFIGSIAGGSLWRRVQRSVLIADLCLSLLDRLEPIRVEMPPLVAVEMFSPDEWICGELSALLKLRLWQIAYLLQVYSSPSTLALLGKCSEARQTAADRDSVREAEM